MLHVYISCCACTVHIYMQFIYNVCMIKDIVSLEPKRQLHTSKMAMFARHLERCKSRGKGRQAIVPPKNPKKNNLLPHHLPHQMASSFITLNKYTMLHIFIYIYIQIQVHVHIDASVLHIPPPKKNNTNITNNIRKSNTFLQPLQSPPARLPALVLLLPGRGKHEDAVEPWDQNPSCERGKNVHLRCLFRWLLVQF